jgi:hypothetical protein
MVYICSNLMDDIPLFRCSLFYVLSFLSRKPSSGRITGGGYIFFNILCPQYFWLVAKMPIYLVTSKQDVPLAVFSTTCRVIIIIDSVLIYADGNNVLTCPSSQVNFFEGFSTECIICLHKIALPHAFKYIWPLSHTLIHLPSPD